MRGGTRGGKQKQKLKKQEISDIIGGLKSVACDMGYGYSIIRTREHNERRHTL
jgi:hypothetical protein